MKRNTPMPLATDFLNSNYFKSRRPRPKRAHRSPPSSRFARATSTTARTSWSSTPTTKDKGVVLNQTRLKTMIAAFGPNFDNNLPGKEDRHPPGFDCILRQDHAGHRRGAGRRDADRRRAAAGSPITVQSGKGTLTSLFRDQPAAGRNPSTTTSRSRGITSTFNG